MRPEEAAWIGSILRMLPDEDVGTVVNIGSSTGRFRSTTQPHIDREIFRPLIERGARVIHCDMKSDEGVDMIGDLTDPEFRAAVMGLRADVVLANNLFEHVADRASLATCIGSLPRDGGRLIVTVPYRYPYHADPIDTLYRPMPSGIAEMFPGYAIEDQRIIGTTSLWQDLTSRLGQKGAIADVLRRLRRMLFPFYRPRAWRATLASLAWLRRTRSVSGVSLRKLKSQLRADA